MEKIGPDGPKWGQEDFFLLIQTLPTFWATRILILRIFIFWIFWAPNLGPAWAQLGPGLGPGLGLGLGPGLGPAWAQTPPAPAPPDELSDPNLTPLPTHPGIKYIARSACYKSAHPTSNDILRKSKILSVQVNVDP